MTNHIEASALPDMWNICISRKNYFFMHNRLLYPQHLGGIWSGLMPYRLPFDTPSEYPEPWLQQTRGSLS